MDRHGEWRVAPPIRHPARPGNEDVDWHLPKAMLWTESGGPSNPSWKKRPLQIGNKGDPAHAVLRAGKEGSDKIMSEALWQALKAGRIDDPKINIQAGIAYLYARMAKFAVKSVRDAKDTKEYEYTVVGGDNLWDIATKKLPTTVDELKASNRKSAGGSIRKGDKLKYHKASMQMVITGWRVFTAEEIADRYNGGGDSECAAKLNYVMKSVFPKLKRTKKP